MERDIPRTVRPRFGCYEYLARRTRSHRARLAVVLLLVAAACRAPGDHARLTAELRTRVQDYRDKSDVAGVNLAVSLPDGTVLRAAAGLADREAGERLETDHRMLAGSVGKIYVAALVLQLVAEHELALDELAVHHFADAPWFSRLPNGQDLTLRMLMSHTTGLPRWVFEPALWQALAADPERTFSGPERLALILDKEPVHPPGQDFAYSDSNYIVLGMILESVTGQSYYQLLRERILEPYALTETEPSDRRELPGLAAGYTAAKNPFGLPAKVAERGVYAVNPQFEWTGGGLMTTPGDLVRFARLLYAGHVLPVGLRADMVRPVDFATQLPGAAGYGLGAFSTQTDIGPEYGHDGFMPGYQTQVRYYRDHDFAIAVQINEDATTGKLQQAPLAEFVHHIATWLAAQLAPASNG